MGRQEVRKSIGLLGEMSRNMNEYFWSGDIKTDGSQLNRKSTNLLIVKW